MIENGDVSVNGEKVKANYKVRVNDEILLNPPEIKEIDIVPENIPLNIVYEDSDMLVVNKPQGMVVHPAVGNYSGTLVNALMYHCAGRLSSINGVIRPGIVHRIDKNTSGLLMVAKTDAAHNFLAAQIKEHSFTREYVAIVCGSFKEAEGTIDAPIGRHHIDRKKMCVTDKNSKNAVTHYSVIEDFDGYSHISLRLKTGRTHQIRVHLSHDKMPIVGDQVYGNRQLDRKIRDCPTRQMLHAAEFSFDHPKTGKRITFKAPLPKDFQELLNHA